MEENCMPTCECVWCRLTPEEQAVIVCAVEGYLSYHREIEERWPGTYPDVAAYQRALGSLTRMFGDWRGSPPLHLRGLRGLRKQ